MDRAKVRLFAGVGGVLFGFTGLIALSVALIVVLAEAIGTAWAITSVSLIYVGVGCAGIYIFLMPHKSSEHELGALEEAGADALADLPVDTIKAFISKRPLAALSFAALLGYTFVQDPKTAGKQAQKLFLGIL